MPDTLAKVPGYGWDAPFQGDAPTTVPTTTKLAKMVSKLAKIHPHKRVTTRRMPFKRKPKFY
jgi:hypothetical protein